VNQKACSFGLWARAVCIDSFGEFRSVFGFVWRSGKAGAAYFDNYLAAVVPTE